MRGGALSLKYLRNERRQSYRLAIIVSRKVHKSAVVRNKIRRRLYERVRILSSSFTGTYDLILIAYDDKIAAMPSAELDREVQKLLIKANLAAPDQPVHGIVKAK